MKLASAAVADTLRTFSFSTVTVISPGLARRLFLRAFDNAVQMKDAAKVNLIPFNPWPGTNYQCSDWETIEKFADFINNAGYASPIRTPRGRDILAACGQLKSESERLKKHERLALEAMMIAGHGE